MMVLTRMDIERSLGPIDDQLAAEIAAIEATPADLAKALAWLGADEALVNEGNALPTGKVAELIGILEVADEEDAHAAPTGETQDWA